MSHGGIHPVIQKILAGRGMDEAAMEKFLAPDYDAHLHDPFLLTDMEPAVNRILEAAERRQSVVIYGDYDIDGITASSIMIEGLRHHGIEAVSYIPDRFEEGYGINLDALKALKDRGIDLVISVDCGITSSAEAAWARENDLDLVITDHHAVPETIPDAIAAINPKRPDDKYPFKDLCGAGVAFKVIQALQQRTGRPAAGQEKWLLDLVALGTVCDVVTLVDENRVLAHYGLMVMRRTRRPGIRALAAVGGIEVGKLTSHHLGFVLGPRMNAAGRLEHAARSVELMMTPDSGRAADIAGELDHLNDERRATQAAVFREADRLAEAYANDPVLVLADPGWSHGIVGIVASKLVEKWRKPVLVAQVLGDGYTKGSARSTGDFNMVEALRANAAIFKKFGGHFYAAGYTFESGRLDELRAGLIRYYAETGANTQVAPELIPDAVLADTDEADLELLELLEALEPFGAANPRPLLSVPARLTDVRKIGKDGSHLKLKLASPGGRALDGIGFGLVPRYPNLSVGTAVTAYGCLDRNEWQGRVSLQLQVSELRF